MRRLLILLLLSAPLFFADRVSAQAKPELRPSGPADETITRTWYLDPMTGLPYLEIIAWTGEYKCSDSLGCVNGVEWKKFGTTDQFTRIDAMEEYNPASQWTLLGYLDTYAYNWNPHSGKIIVRVFLENVTNGKRSTQMHRTLDVP